MSGKSQKVPPGIQVIQRASGVRYRAYVDLPPRDGKRRRETKVFERLNDAKDWQQSTRARIAAGTYDGKSPMTVTECCDLWLSERAISVRTVTLNGYRSSLSAHVMKRLGDVPVQDLSRRDVINLRDQMIAHGKSGRTVGHTLTMLRSVLELARRDGIISQNPAEFVQSPPQTPKHDRRAMTPEQISRVSATATEDRLGGCWMLTLAGLRRSEILALNWADIDLKKRRVSVTKGRVAVDGSKTEVEKPKTARGARVLPLPEFMVKGLRSMLTTRKREAMALGERVRPGDPLAVNEILEPVRPEWYSDEWRRLCTRAKVPGFTLHEARHSSVTMMRAAGVPDRIVAEWHGHDENVMRHTYDHVRSDSELEAAGKVWSQIAQGRGE